DSSFKLGQRIIEAAIHHLDGPEAPLYALTIAAWIRYNTGQDMQGRTIPVSDPLAAHFRQIDLAAQGDAAALVDGFLQLDLFAGPLRQHQPFRGQLVAFCTALARQTPHDLMAAAASGDPKEKTCSQR
ncbi:MAG: mannitol dehydrogenase family protein, partial [Yoonia sp.]